VLPKRHFSTDPEPFGVRTGSNGDPKEALKIFVPQDKGEGARRQEMDLTPAGSQKIHHRYNGEIRSHARHGENRVRREIPEKSAVRHVCVWEEGGWWGEEIFSIRARSGVALRGYPSRIGLSVEQVTNVSFTSWGYYPYGRGKEEGSERGGKEKKPPVGAGTYAS
jgi:hypothetical protein